MHKGYNLKWNGFRKLAEAHFSKNLTLNKKRAKEKISESIRGEKKVQENLPFTHDPVKIENKK